MTGAARQATVSGFLLAVGSAATFALSGIFASSLISAGWSAGAAATARICVAALVLGLVTISGLAAGGALHPLGIAFALIAAVGNAAYYAAGAASDHGVPPLPFVGLGLAVAAVSLAIVSALGILPFTVTSVQPVIAGQEVSPVLVVLGMAFISTVMAYVLGVSASRRLGATVASFTGYSEPLFGIIWTIVLLSIVPTGTQWLGAALILAGVVAVKLGEMRAARRVTAATQYAA